MIDRLFSIAVGLVTFAICAFWAVGHLASARMLMRDPDKRQFGWQIAVGLAFAIGAFLAATRILEGIKG